MKPIDLGDKREFFWDDYLIDETDAKIVQHEPSYREDSFTCGHTWEGTLSNYFDVVCDGNMYRMYYKGCDTSTRRDYCCYAESLDGIYWVQPDLNKSEFEGSTHNNIFLNDRGHDNFFVFIDENPDCPPEEKYKGLSGYDKPIELHGYVSPDGINFKYIGVVGKDGNFDSLNVCFWNEEKKEYHSYVRGSHMVGDVKVRDVRFRKSKNFRTWTEAEPIIFDEGKADLQLYTNNIKPYYRAPHMRIGFPARYKERPWFSTYERLPGLENRKKRMARLTRLGTAITDTVIMTSRDGIHFDRRDEAFFTSGHENGKNWGYGDAFTAYGMVETKSKIPGADNEISMYKTRDAWSGPMTLERWTIRIDGFFSLKSTLKPCFLKTKPLIFKGSKLSVNLSTSALGYVKFALLTEDGKRYEAVEAFGDSIDYKIDFPELPDLSVLEGVPVVLEAEMSDCDIYSLKFE